MFLLLSGVIDLVHESEGNDQVVTHLEAGQFLGERAILTGELFLRVFGARTRSPVRLLELSLKDVHKLQEESAPLVVDLLKGMVLVQSDRIQRANQLVELLRTNNMENKLLSLLVFLCKTGGKASPQGTEVTIEQQTFHYYVDMSNQLIQETLTRWEEALLLSCGEGGIITIFDIPAFESNLNNGADASRALAAMS